MKYSKLFEDVCELYGMLSLSRCSPFAFAEQSLSLDTRDKNPLACRYNEYYWLENGTEDPISTGMGSRVMFMDFDEANREHQFGLSAAIMELKKEFSSKRIRPFYKSMLFSYHSTNTLTISQLKDIKKQLSSALLYRKTYGNLIDLEFNKDFFIEIPVDGFENEYKLYGRLLFYVRESNKGKFLDISMWKGFHLNEEEFEKLKKIVKTYGFEDIRGNDHTKDFPKSRFPNLTLDDLKALILT